MEWNITSLYFGTTHFFAENIEIKGVVILVVSKSLNFGTASYVPRSTVLSECSENRGSLSSDCIIFQLF